jgi:hypothetical protein
VCPAKDKSQILARDKRPSLFIIVFVTMNSYFISAFNEYGSKISNTISSHGTESKNEDALKPVLKPVPEPVLGQPIKSEPKVSQEDCQKSLNTGQTFKNPGQRTMEDIIR